MSDTATNGSLDSFLLDGDAPRLGASMPMQPGPSILDYELLAAEPVVAAPVAGSMLLPPRLDAEPVLLALDGPSLPTAAAKSPVPFADGEQAEEPRHPMAHLMPEHGPKSESQVWAAQLRAAKKAKARKVKAIAALVFVVVAAIVGPPLGKWLVDAINESGKTGEAPAAVPADTDPVAVTTAPAVPTTAAPAGLLGLPGQATDAVGQVNGDVTGATPPATATPVAAATSVAP